MRLTFTVTLVTLLSRHGVTGSTDNTCSLVGSAHVYSWAVSVTCWPLPRAWTGIRMVADWPD